MAETFSSIEKLEREHRPDDTIIQRSSINDDLPRMLREALTESEQHGGLRFYGYRYELVPDGAGEIHYNLYVFFEPAEYRTPLDPRNLNGAEQALFGQTITSQELAEKAIGAKELRF